MRAADERLEARVVIETRNLTKRYEDGTLAVDALDLKVETGEIYCLLGANGSGKTTTINLLLNFVQPTFGEALINGVDVTKHALESKRHVAYLSENATHYEDFTSRQNLQFFSILGGNEVSKGDCYYMMRRVGLPEAAFEKRVRNLGKGMRQKLGIAICILKQTPALLLDEPMAGLDPTTARDIGDLLLDLRAEGHAILLSTHDVFQAMAVGDRIGIMKEGRKVIERTRAELGEESLEVLYIGYMSGETRRAAAAFDLAEAAQIPERNPR